MIKKHSFAYQNIGVIGIMMALFAAIVSGYVASGSDRIEILFMSLFMFIPMMFASFRIRGLSLAIVGVQILAYAIYKIYMLSAYTVTISPVCYAWLFIPVVMVFSMNMFVIALKHLDEYNDYLEIQTENLVMIDDVTGMYNRRSLFNDLERTRAYATRRGFDLSMLIVEFKYAEELRRILSKSQFNTLKRIFAEQLGEHLRLEDRIYSINEDGGLAIILLIDKIGTEAVIKKIRSFVKEKSLFNEVLGRELTVDIKIGCLQYNKEEHRDVVDFFHKTENELQYDV